MAIVVLIVASLALFAPQTALWLQQSWVNYLLMVAMFGMGLTLKGSDFGAVFSRPKDVLIGCLAQFTIMPALAYALGKAFMLPPELLAGVVLVGTCPGGTSSNVITYLSRGDVALSVAITSVNTTLAPILTPALSWLILRTTIHVDLMTMFVTIAEVVIAPIVAGLLMNRFWRTGASKLARVTPYLSIAAICLIVGAVVSHNAEKIRSTAQIVFLVVFLHNGLGYLGGFLVGKALRLPANKTKALSIEIGMQNSGLATVLAQEVFKTAPLAAAPGAIFSVWHNISGAALAELFKRWNPASPDQPVATREEDVATEFGNRPHEGTSNSALKISETGDDK